MSNEQAPKLEDILNLPLKRTGVDVPEGSYPGTLFGFGVPFMLKQAAEYVKSGQPSERPVFEAKFAVRAKDGTVQQLDYLLPVSTNGGINRRSNLYKMLRALKGTDSNYFKQDSSGDFAEGIKLSSFIGCYGVVQVKKNKKDFPQIETIASPIEGLRYPTMEEWKKLEIDASEDIPF